MSQFELSLSFKDLLSLQILLGNIVVCTGIVWIGNEGIVVAIVAEIRVIGGPSGVLHLLPMERFSTTGSALSSVRILIARVAVAVRCVTVVSWSIKPHLWGVQ